MNVRNTVTSSKLTGLEMVRTPAALDVAEDDADADDDAAVAELPPV